MKRRSLALAVVALLLVLLGASALTNLGPGRSLILGSTASHFEDRAVDVAAAWGADPANTWPPGAMPDGGSPGQPDTTSLGARALVPVWWRAPQPDPQTLLLVAEIGSCDTHLEPLLWESPDVVVVGAAVREPQSSGCNDMLNAREITVTLHAPLGIRALLDAYTGGPLAPGWSF